jgi:hypothetical protein
LHADQVESANIGGVTANARSLPPASAILYCRRARRIRHEHAGNPSRKHAELQALSHEADAVQPAKPKAEFAPPAAMSFTALVRRQLTGPVLPYSQRLSLLRQAPRYHLTPFHANLLIAAIQYEQAEDQLATPTPSHLFPILCPVIALLLTELFAVWWIISA